MVCIDIYLNETTRHADLILPPTSPLERDHYPLLFHALSVRNTAHYTEALYPKPEGSKEDWEIFVELGRRFSKHIGTLSALSARFQHRLGGALGPRRMLDLFLRAGPHPLTVKKLLAAPHGIDLGALEPRLPKILATPGRKLRLVPELFQADRLRLEQELGAEPHDLVLIGRRDLRSNNSWMHNSQRLVKGPKRCSLLMNPADAESRGLDDGARVALTTRIGTIDVELQISDEMKPGVVCLPHGWGHNREGIRLSVASEHAGQSFNDITDEAAIDTLSGTAILTGFAVTVKEAT